jgi:hypothetical protein
MTDILQILDLIVNGPIKRHIRARREMEVYNYFNGIYKRQIALELSKPVSERNRVIFSPPKPSLQDAILDAFELFENNFQGEEMQQNIWQCFIETGCAPVQSAYGVALDRANISFMEYGSEGAAGADSFGTSIVSPTGTEDIIFTSDQINDFIQEANDYLMDEDVDSDAEASEDEL